MHGYIQMYIKHSLFEERCIQNEKIKKNCIAFFSGGGRGRILTLTWIKQSASQGRVPYGNMEINASHSTQQEMC